MRDETDCSGNLVLRQPLPTGLHDLELESVGSLRRVAIAGRRPENDVGNDNRAGEGILARAHERHSHGRVPVDDSLDFLGMYLQPTDIDNPAAPADEVVAIAAQLDKVT